MRRLLRPRPVALALLLAAVVAVIVYRPWIGAQARAFVVLSITLKTPFLAWAVRVATDEPRAEETVVAGVPTTVVRPGGGDRWPVLVFVNGATARGRHHPAVQRLARGLARAGYVVLVPDLPGLARGEISDRTVAATVAVARAAADRPDVRGGRVGLVGVSVGTTLALLAAEDPALAERVSVVAGIAPYTDLAKVVRLATTGLYREGGRLVRYRHSSFVALAVARSLVSGLPAGRDRRLLVARLRAVDDDAHDPLAGLRALSTAHLSPAARAVVELLANRDPRRFDKLYAALPVQLRAGIERLSPLSAARRLRAPVVLASAPHDKYFPLAESRALARAATGVELTVTPTLAHAVPKPSFGDLAGLFRFDGFVVRALHASSAHGSRARAGFGPTSRGQLALCPAGSGCQSGASLSAPSLVSFLTPPPSAFMT